MLYTNRNVRIVGTGSFAPERIVTNEELCTRVDTSSEWIFENLGIRERRVAADGQFTSDLAYEAAKRAIDDAGLVPNQIDLIIVATATADRQAPSTACIVQEKLGITNRCPAFDISAVCSGFLYAMTIASQFVQNGMYNNVVVIGADTFSRITDWSRRDCVFFGDGAGAAVLQGTDSRDCLFSSVLYADGRGQDNFTVHPGDDYFTMNGRAVYETGTNVLPSAIRTVIEANQLSLADVSVVIPHQPSIRILRDTSRLLGLPFEKFRTNMDRYANTSGATIPLLLDEVRRDGGLRHGDLVVFAAVGSGWTWGAAICRWWMRD